MSGSIILKRFLIYDDESLDDDEKYVLFCDLKKDELQECLSWVERKHRLDIEEIQEDCRLIMHVKMDWSLFWINIKI